MEQRLAEYRARKAKHHQEDAQTSDSQTGKEQAKKSLTQTLKERFHRVCNRWRTPDIAGHQNMAPTIQTSEPREEAALLDDTSSSRSKWKVTLLLKVLLWLVLLGLFVELEFGLAYFVLSMFYWLYEGTRGPGQKRKGEKSAYSVFNPGCEAIDGTLTAEQFERELQYGTLTGI
ncbi:SAYSvFN domain-containing protein 1 [Rana temporaria]|uniref:SAYSvFN domain-containing protein 1 n=1 Tax=Rana temporaria TaxID=8407 RepID=UPI001AADE419|nr:SAYSvFN domain-containing protein 1 [Rana temporaria]